MASTAPGGNMITFERFTMIFCDLNLSMIIYYALINPIQAKGSL